MFEEVIRIRVTDGADIEVTGLGIEPIIPIGQDQKARHARMCEIMSMAIGQELGQTFESEEVAVKAAARCANVILTELAKVLEKKSPPGLK